MTDPSMFLDRFIFFGDARVSNVDVCRSTFVFGRERSFFDI
jgi:hypothetical protein